MRRLVVILLFLLGVVTAAQAQPGTQSVLTAVSGQGIGRVNVSPSKLATTTWKATSQFEESQGP